MTTTMKVEWEAVHVADLSITGCLDMGLDRAKTLYRRQAEFDPRFTFVLPDGGLIGAAFTNFPNDPDAKAHIMYFVRVLGVALDAIAVFAFYEAWVVRSKDPNLAVQLENGRRVSQHRDREEALFIYAESREEIGTRLYWIRRNSKGRVVRLDPDEPFAPVSRRDENGVQGTMTSLIATWAPEPQAIGEARDLLKSAFGVDIDQVLQEQGRRPTFN